MTKHSTAGKTLARGGSFVNQAEVAGIGNRQAFELDLEAAIVFRRSVTVHLQKEYRRRLGFQSWYSDQQSIMEADPIFKFFRDTRNFIEGRPSSTLPEVLNLREGVI
jgi:hypothetical protein